MKTLVAILATSSLLLLACGSEDDPEGAGGAGGQLEGQGGEGGTIVPDPFADARSVSADACSDESGALSRIRVTGHDEAGERCVHIRLASGGGAMQFNIDVQEGWGIERLELAAGSCDAPEDPTSTAHMAAGTIEIAGGAASITMNVAAAFLVEREDGPEMLRLELDQHALGPCFEEPGLASN